MTDLFMGKIDYNNFGKCMQKAAAELPTLFNTRMKESQRWNPYTNEEGSTAAIAGKDFVVAASDSRLTQHGVNILSRNAEKTYILNDNIILNNAGFQGDVLQMRRVLEFRLHKYRFDYNRDMSADICAEMLARILYYKRFFPYYTGVVLSGIDEKGVGAIYSYDPVGCIERLQSCASGSAEPILVPFLDSQLERNDIPPVGHATGYSLVDLSVEDAVAMIKDAFNFAAERESCTGDTLNVIVARAGKKIEKTSFPLRKD